MRQDVRSTARALAPSRTPSHHRPLPAGAKEPAMKKSARKLNLNRETLAALAPERLDAVGGGSLVTHSCAGSCIFHTCATCGQVTCVVC